MVFSGDLSKSNSIIKNGGEEKLDSNQPPEVEGEKWKKKKKKDGILIFLQKKKKKEDEKMPFFAENDTIARKRKKN